MTQTPWRFPMAQRFSGVTSSPVHDIPEVISRGDVISFAGGIPDAQLFALQDIRASFDHVLSHQGRRALQYASTEGEPALRTRAAARVSAQVSTTTEQIQVTSGSQPGLYPVGQALPDAGDVVLVERPTYLAAQPGMPSRTLLLNGVSKIMALGRRGSA